MRFAVTASYVFFNSLTPTLSHGERGRLKGGVAKGSYPFSLREKAGMRG